MRIAVFSDVHGNLKALKALLEQIKEKNVEQIIFLGDIFQRGNEEVECLELLKSNEIVCLKGNCELYMTYGVDIDPDVEYLREYYDTTRKKLTIEQIEFIKQMPLFYEKECNGHKMHFSHFLFSDINAAYPFLQLADLKNGVFDNACKKEDVMKYELVVVGHSHQNFVKGNVVSVSATGLEGASYLLIEVNEDGVSFEHICINAQIIADMLSGDENRILNASHTVIYSAIKNRKLIQELHPYLPEIKEKTCNLNYGGTMLPNKRFVEKAIRMIEDSVENKCLCEYLFDGFGQNGKNMVQYGFVLLEENNDIENYINRSIVECSNCHQKYEVEEEYTGWHITTTRHRRIDDNVE